MRLTIPLALACLFVSPVTHAEVPTTLGHQGRILKPDGSVQTGTHAITFRLFGAATGGTALWNETQNVALANGLYSAILGVTTAIPQAAFDSPALWLEVEIGGQTLAPRHAIVAVPFARKAFSVAGGSVVTPDLAIDGTLDWRIRVQGSNLHVTHPNSATPALILQNDNSARIPRLITNAIADEPGDPAPGLFEGSWRFGGDMAVGGTLTAGLARLFDPEVTGGLYWHIPFRPLQRRWVGIVDEFSRLKFERIGSGRYTLRLSANDDVEVGRDLYVAGPIRAANAGTLILGSNTQIVGNFSVTGTKAFVQDHPRDKTKEIVYVALEGGEAGTYWRGTVKLAKGEARVKLPEHFALVTNPATVTVQVTPSLACQGWVAAEVDASFELAIAERGAKDDCEVDYLVQGKRAGFENHQVIRARTARATKTAARP